MDTLSHALYGGVAFGRKSKVSYWKAFAIGLAPDFLSFGIFTASSVLGLVSGTILAAPRMWLAQQAAGADQSPPAPTSRRSTRGRAA